MGLDLAKVNSSVRALGEELMRETLADEEHFHDWSYDAVRPMPVPAAWKPGQKVRGDCSKGCQYISHWSHGPDPMGNGWSQYGNSQTMWAHMQHLTSPSQLQILDMITFGHWGNEHAAIVLVTGADPILWSFGHQGAPNTYRLSWDHRPAQYLHLPVVYVPTPDDYLRARTGWFAWVGWKLGEGDWRHHHPEDPRVRPAVPAHIGLPSNGTGQWWIRYQQFLLNRKNGNRATTPIKQGGS